MNNDEQAFRQFWASDPELGTFDPETNARMAFYAGWKAAEAKRDREQLNSSIANAGYDYVLR